VCIPSFNKVRLSQEYAEKREKVSQPEVNSRGSSAGEFHRRALSEPDVNPSAHTAPAVEPPARQCPDATAGLASLIGSSHCWLTRRVRPYNITLGSILFSGTSSLLRVIPPLCSASGLDPCGSSTWISPFASLLQVPTFHTAASWQTQATSMPDAAPSVNRFSPEVIPQ